jgi:hypothetical protein
LKTKVSFWLIPAEVDRNFFQEIIDTLARTYSAPSFTPHVTIYSGVSRADESPADFIEKASQGVQPLSLQVDQLLYSDQFTKTLFVQFYPEVILRQISETLRSSSSQPSDFTLNPHLSLIYQSLSEAQKQDILSQIHLSRSAVFFSEIWAIATPKNVHSREDVESWKVICTKQL